MKTLRMVASCLAVLAVFALPAVALQPLYEKQQQQPATPPPPAVSDATVIQDILQTSDPVERLAKVEKFLTDYPQSAYRGHALLAAAEAHRLQNNFAKAIEYGDRALELNPRNAIALILVADALSEGSQASQPDFPEKMLKAEDYSRKALTMLPELFASQQRNPNVPVEQYKLQEDYIEAQVHATLGYIYYRRNEFPAAEEELRMATDMNQLRPNSADFERLGLVQVQEKKYDLARISFQRCIEAGGVSAETCQRRLELLDKIIQQEQPKQEPKPQE